jgi:eukaryotic-like serine/threonine-protein kinase
MDAEKLQVSLIGKYELQGEVGRGGMATVYRALDVKHGRQVALKVLDPELGAVLGAERFLSEIRVTAALQHPNLLPLFDSGEADGLLYYVMPLVDGESLRAKLDREKQFSVEEAVRMTVAIATALEYAHRNGVIHRDLKPENILLQAGQPVVADFGIALAVSRAGGARVTQTGLSLGTPQYMSPEQATGDRGLDARTDQYSLAAICYEMLAGEPPHIGSTAQAIIAKLMTETPRPVTVLRRTVPAPVSEALRRALEKLPADRFGSVGEFAQALQATTVSSPVATAIAGAPRASGLRRVMAAVAVVLVAGVAAASAYWVATQQAPAVSSVRVAMLLPDTMEPAPFARFAISQRGRYLAYVSDDTGGRALWVKEQGAPWPRVVNRATALGSGSIAFSPDEASLVWVEGSTAMRASVDGSGAVRVTDGVGAGSGLTYVRGDSLAYVAVGAIELRVVSASGGTSRLLWRSDSGTIQAPRALPDGRHVLVTNCRGAACSRGLDVIAVDLASGSRHLVVANANMGWLVTPGYFVFSRDDGTLWASRINLTTMQRTSDPVVVQDGIETFNGLPIVGVGPDGTMLMRRGSSIEVTATYTMQWVDREGNATALDTSSHIRLTNYGGNAGWALSPDGKRLAIGLNTKSGDDIWIKDLPNGPLSRLTFDNLSEVRPRWSRDGRYVWYVTAGGTQVASGVARRLSNGSGDAEEMFPNRPGGPFEVVLTPDAKQVIVRTGGTVNVVNGRDVGVSDLDASGRPGPLKPLLADSTIDEAGIALSPDGRWLAYESNETGRTEVFIRPFPNVNGGRWQVSTDGGQAPLWQRDGRELFYVDGKREMVAVRLTPAASDPGIGARTRLFALTQDYYLTSRERYTPFDISLDGQRFLMARADRLTERRATPVIMAIGWRQDLETRLRGR